MDKAIIAIIILNALSILAMMIAAHAIRLADRAIRKVSSSRDSRRDSISLSRFDCSLPSQPSTKDRSRGAVYSPVSYTHLTLPTN